jgi:hypothetical protein
MFEAYFSHQHPHAKLKIVKHNPTFLAPCYFEFLEVLFSVPFRESRKAHLQQQNEKHNERNDHNWKILKGNLKNWSNFRGVLTFRVMQI